MKTAEDILNDKRPFKIITIAPDQTVAAAIQRMNQANIGAILVEDQGEMLGIWTERDLLRAMAQPDFDPRHAPIGDHMTTQLHSAAHDTEVVRLEEMFLGLFIRHILIRKADHYIGLLSIGDVLRASLLEKDRRIRELNSIASWQYYENWGWDRKKAVSKKTD
ncbi:CBS domain-containing protein [Desulfatitalea alkaliphila]|uniref:CBS domain-containing protein n=1 Tax=Desulfatitalea alkaliphila TaxID=2929485 RepID=A0AA41R3L1_9BACT|nr:CBS domain-containing protein [Desulfatitalea alkaliphila]MCJ8501684.1 CBS domain-containing protein [Desulfatitalea alkaliphila]